ncbi:MAG: hypothetical protein IJS72_00470 [Oscillospiraceae bacterium]|nr:hypothetical protein [Oscillospiraceae bacterium]
MASIRQSSDERIFTIKRWRGVNEAEEGEAALKAGEGAVCRNFRVTAGGALQKRPGSANKVTLATEFITIETDTEKTAVSYGYDTLKPVLYPRIDATDSGELELDGTAVEPDFNDANTYADYYGTAYKRSGTSTDLGGFYRFKSAVKTERTLIETKAARYAGQPKSSWSGQMEDYIYAWFIIYDTLLWNGSEYTGTNPQIVNNGESSAFDGTKYTLLTSDGRPVSFFRKTAQKPTEADFLAEAAASGRIGKIRSDPDYDSYTSITNTPLWKLGLLTDVYSEAEYKLTYNKMEAIPNPSTDTSVKAIWSGFVGGREVIIAACSDALWELSETDGEWARIMAGNIDTSDCVHIFGFDGKAYILAGGEYKVWDGETTLRAVDGYIPVVVTASPPEGGGTSLERVNLLTQKRRVRFSPVSTSSAVYTLPEKNLVSIDSAKDLTTGAAVTLGTIDLTAGTVQITAPHTGANALEVVYTAGGDESGSVCGMKYSELYNGATDTRVFLYGDGSNKVIYSDLDENGEARADYFPALNEIAIGDSNTPVTALIRYYDSLMCFKLDSTWGVRYDAITLEDGTVTAGFTVTPINRDIGSCAYGEARLVENRPRTLDGKSVIEWKSAGAYLTQDQRNAERISQRVGESIMSFDLTKAHTYYDKITHEYYVIDEGGDALIHNVEADAWYIYTGFDARCMINYKDEVYYGDGDGYIRHFSKDYSGDNGEAIDCRWESGAMDFSADYRRKFSAMVWVGIKPEDGAGLIVSAVTDRKTDFAKYLVTLNNSSGVPEMRRIKLKAKKFTYYKLTFEGAGNAAATIVSADIRIRSTGYVR